VEFDLDGSLVDEFTVGVLQLDDAVLVCSGHAVMLMVRLNWHEQPIHHPLRIDVTWSIMDTYV
jgi:hypothetical protein